MTQLSRVGKDEILRGLPLYLLFNSRWLSERES